MIKWFYVDEILPGKRPKSVHINAGPLIMQFGPWGVAVQAPPTQYWLGDAHVLIDIGVLLKRPHI